MNVCTLYTYLGLALRDSDNISGIYLKTVHNDLLTGGRVGWAFLYLHYSIYMSVVDPVNK